jgi:hypothetical protein
MVSLMNGPNAVGNKVQFQPAGGTRGIFDGYGSRGIDKSEPQDLDDLDENRFEHRSHQRFRLDKDAYALIRAFSRGPLKIGGKSMGCIACAVFNARPAKLGMIDDISMGGLAFQHAESKTESDDPLVLDILLADC